ncbi:origin recognition complex, subunit 6 [Scheffersomyces xylosifermentans]|uniref:origin recognition complex, subunit 6 n=1 Tax=Scheffersomyces xylosifermentans TaxID=1304137 RepID=UPI00315CBCDA
MSSNQQNTLKDIIPTHVGAYPPQLLSFVDSLYQLSLQKKPTLPNRANVARYHICAYLAVEKYQNILSLPEPETRKIPLQPKVVVKIIDDFRENLVNQIQSPSSTPKSTRTPTKELESAYSTPFSSPTKLRNNASPSKVQRPVNGSPLKRLQGLKDDVRTPKKRKTLNGSSPMKSNDLRDEESPFNPKPSSKSATESPKTPTIYKYDRKHVSIVDFITFANNFYIPSDITPKMIETFLVHKHKFIKKSEWLLACGMINAAYIRINHKLLTAKIGARQEVNNQLFQYQKGGLMKWNMQLFCDIVEDWIKDEPWILEIERKYMYGKQTMQEMQTIKEKDARIGPGWTLIEKFGSMIHGDVLYESQNQIEYYDTWKQRVLAKLEN